MFEDEDSLGPLEGREDHHQTEPVRAVSHHDQGKEQVGCSLSGLPLKLARGREKGRNGGREREVEGEIIEEDSILGICCLRCFSGDVAGLYGANYS